MIREMLIIKNYTKPISILFFLVQISIFISPSDGYDPLDPNGNITIKWDIMHRRADVYNAMVTIYNYQLFRHVERPGWKLTWTWNSTLDNNTEVIWNIQGAEATEQGDCSRIKSDTLPHCCMRKPVIVDLLPGAPYNMQASNCCKGGLLTTMTQDRTKYGASFLMSVGLAPVEEDGTNKTIIPRDFNIGLPGYTCGPPKRVEPSKFTTDKRHYTQALMTWNITCSYSQFIASTAPTCCVSLSAFYNNTIVPCPKCSCACQGLPGQKCIKPGDSPSFLELPHSEDEVVPPAVMCTQHMCPIRVHWHVKVSYKEYWRVKMTVTNLNFVKNYTQWSLVVQHPNLRSVTQVFSFNYKPLNQYAVVNDSGMFWGIQYYNDMLLQSGESGNVQSEMLLHKDPGMFTFQDGWAFPRKISFNGDECVMPPPDEFPGLPVKNHSPAITRPYLFPLLSFLIMLLLH